MQEGAEHSAMLQPIMMQQACVGCSVMQEELEGVPESPRCNNNKRHHAATSKPLHLDFGGMGGGGGDV